MPGIAEAYRAAQAGIAVAADPDRYLPAAVVLVVVPGGAHSPEAVVGQFPALAERNAQCAELLPCPADGDAQDQPSVAELVKIGGHPGGQQRVPVRRYEHRGS